MQTIKFKAKENAIERLIGAAQALWISPMDAFTQEDIEVMLSALCTDLLLVQVDRILIDDTFIQTWCDQCNFIGITEPKVKVIFYDLIQTAKDNQ